MRLVTLDEVKRQLVYDNALSDAALTFRLESVSATLLDYIGSHSTNGLAGWTDSSGLPIPDSNGDAIDVPGHVQAATICALAAWDEQRGADIITPAVRSLLERTRCPVVV